MPDADVPCMHCLYILFLPASHKLFKGIHRIAGTKATVKATDTALTPEQKQSAVYSYDCKPASTGEWMSSAHNNNAIPSNELFLFQTVTK